MQISITKVLAVCTKKGMFTFDMEMTTTQYIFNQVKTSVEVLLLKSALCRILGNCKQISPPSVLIKNELKSWFFFETFATYLVNLLYYVVFCELIG